MPPPDEQVAIHDAVRSEHRRLKQLVSLNASQIQKLREYRQTLISAAVTGQIDVRREIEVPA